jgi:tRNA threonylcarbamoyladenosine biosynthesis protein TsaE
MDGALGAGKTTLVRAVAAELGLNTEAVASPTYVVVHEYTRDDVEASSERPDLIHVDAYRLRSAEDLDSLGWDRLVEESGGGTSRSVLMIEWAERLGAGFLDGREAARVHIEHAGEESRELAFDVPDSWRERPSMDVLRAAGPVRCPITGRMVEPGNPTYPFAHERARRADLYRWFSGSYGISRPLTEADFDEPPPERG